MSAYKEGATYYNAIEYPRPTYDGLTSVISGALHTPTTKAEKMPTIPSDASVKQFKKQVKKWAADAIVTKAEPANVQQKKVAKLNKLIAKSGKNTEKLEALTAELKQGQSVEKSWLADGNGNPRITKDTPFNDAFGMLMGNPYPAKRFVDISGTR